MGKSIATKISDFKEDLARLQQSHDQAKGALDTKIKMLKDKFGFEDLEVARKQLKEYTEEIDSLQQELDVLILGFEKEFKEFLPSLR